MARPALVASNAMVIENVTDPMRMPSVMCANARHVRVEVHGAKICAITLSTVREVPRRHHPAAWRLLGRVVPTPEETTVSRPEGH